MKANFKFFPWAVCHLSGGAVCAGAILLLSVSAEAQNLFVGASGSIYEFTPGGVQSTFASNVAGPLACDSAGNLFVATGSGNIYKFTPNGARSSFVSGLFAFFGLAFNSAGDLFADTDNLVYEFTPGGTQSIFTSAVNGPEGLAFNSAGDLFEADLGGNSIYEFAPTGARSTFASGLSVPVALAFNSTGDLFEADLGSESIHEFTPSGAQSTFASGLFELSGLAFNSAGDLFASTGNGIIEIKPDGTQSVFASGSGYGALAFQPVPEPSALGLLVVGVCALVACNRRSRRRSSVKPKPSLTKMSFKSSHWAMCPLPGGAAGVGLTFLLLATTINSQAQYNYTTLSVPGGASVYNGGGTYATGISGNYIAGYYVSSSGYYCGFLYNGGSYTTFSVPGAVGTYATGISGNDIVGYYYNSFGGIPQGFLYSGSSYTALDVPGANYTEAFGISVSNVVGWYDSNNGWYGFLYNGSTYTTLSVPGSQAGVTFARGISGNDIVGYYYNASGFACGFLYNGNTYATLNVPGALQTWAYGISSNNVVGYYYNASGIACGFLYNISSQTFTTLSVPGGWDTYAFGISGNDIVGQYGNSSYTYSFLATPALPELAATVTNGLLQVTVSMTSPYSTILQSSTNMVNWVSIYTNTPPFTFTEPMQTTLPNRFYRALVSL